MPNIKRKIDHGPHFPSSTGSDIELELVKANLFMIFRPLPTKGMARYYMQIKSKK